MLTEEAHHIVAIGASAGSLEEIISFFERTPLDSVSYVIVQHLSSDFKSRMTELLSSHSKLIVNEAEDGMSVRNNEVYLIPNDKFMTIHNRKLRLTGKENFQPPHLTINRFFNSLAADVGNKSIGVILSGLGNDGTEGIKAIKKAGGMVVARNPETTVFGNMPSNAIATGLVDFVLEPELIPVAIEDYINYAGKLFAENNDDEKIILDITELIKESSPLDFSDYKLTTILRRTKRRAAYCNFTSLRDYFEYLKITPKEVEVLTRDFLISVTSFFRDNEAFDFISESVLPGILRRLVPGEELKLWVAGCATGEEAYSMAILISEQLTGNLKDIAVKIFATDIDSIALVHAGRGVYGHGIGKYVTQERLEKHFLKEGNQYRVKPDIRKMVIFAQHDLVRNPPYCNMHFISCRNLLIYMTPVLQKKVFNMLLFGLKREGYLFLGTSENPLPIIKNLEVINKKWKIYKNLETKRVVSFETFSLPESHDSKRSASLFARENSSKNTSNSLAEIVNMNLVSELDCLVVCIDENHHVVKSYGDTTKYLLQKNFTTNLTELLQRPLAVALNALCNKALRTNQKADVKGIEIAYGETNIRINLSVIPSKLKQGEQSMLTIIFSEEKSGMNVLPEGKVFDEQIFMNEYTLNLEKEIKDLKDKLHSAYEQLDASNENMQSFNEELLSANEEMQSTNEEMQSVNEELFTINSDYQLKNKELVEINDDLNNYFRSNINGQLVINNDLLLMKFSPGTLNQINLLETDIGRPLSNISTNIKFETIIEDINKVLVDGSVIVKEIQTKNNKWYQIMTMPYIQQADNKTNGAIITFNDITELKQTQQELDKKNKSLLRINADLDNFVHTASHDLLAPLGNIEASIALINEIKVGDPELEGFLQVINSSIKKFRALIKDISTVAKIESGAIETEMVDLNDIINNIEWSLSDRISSSGATIKRNFHVTHILFSKKNLRSILYNLISNGIKFRSNKPPVINISTVMEGDNVVLSVKDNGIGMAKGDVDRIFNLYGRLQNEVEGQGIGLYLAKKIIDATGGNVIVESEPGKGSKFTLYFVAEPGLNDL